jgi:hypothetical protein
VSAEEIIEQIKALPSEDKAAVMEFLRSLDVARPNPRFIDPAEAKRHPDKVFDEHDELFRKLAQQ